MKTVENWRLVNEGKVRSCYEGSDADGEYLALVASDRVSAFDSILPTGINGKGKILTKMSAFWFEKTDDIAPNAFLTINNEEMNPLFQKPEFEGRTTIMKKLKMLPIEAIVRGHITGSLWKAYDKEGLREFCGLDIPDGLKNCSKLEEPLFTPTNKAPQGQHDENVTFDEMEALIKQANFPDAEELAAKVRDYSLKLYDFGYKYASEHGIILADTKFEFGIDNEGNLLVADEMLTPDSSRFWPKDEFEEGHDQPSMDKQIIRDFVAAKPGDVIPGEVIVQTIKAYEQVYTMLTI